MSWADEIEDAMRRGGSPYGVDDVLTWLRRGQARLFVAEDLHASLVIWPHGEAEVGHMYGRWNSCQARWLIERGRAWLAERGIDDFTVRGRPGWARFLRMRGIRA